MAIEDSAELASLLSNNPPSEELWRTYERNRQYRARVVQSITFLLSPLSLLLLFSFPPPSLLLLILSTSRNLFSTPSLLLYNIVTVLDISRWIASVGQANAPLSTLRDLLMRATPDLFMTPAFNYVLRYCLGWNYSPPSFA